MNTSLEDLNDNQYEALKQFKNNISDVLPKDYSDVWLLKWLRAHSYNLKKTEALFRGTMRARTVYEFETMVDNYVKPEVASKYEFTASMGLAKDGSPIRYSQFGAGDLIGFLMSLSGYEISLYCTYQIEYDLAVMKKHNEETGKQVSVITYVLDLEGLSITALMYKMAIETGLDLLQMMQDHYPETWGNILIVNAPVYFDKAFNVFKPILRLNMLQKIRVVSKESTPALLLKYIDEDVLPAFLGGKRVDSFGNPRCSEFLKFGGKVPEEYYLRNKTPLMPSDSGVTSVWVTARSVFNYAAVVRQAPAKINVEFRTENGSIGLKMLYREFGNDPDALDLPPCDEYLDESNPECNVKFVSPALRMQTHVTPIDQIVNAPWPGIYIFRFDNTFSWFTSRRIIFRIRVQQNSH